MRSIFTSHPTKKNLLSFHTKVALNLYTLKSLCWRQASYIPQVLCIISQWTSKIVFTYTRVPKRITKIAESFMADRRSPEIKLSHVHSGSKWTLLYLAYFINHLWWRLAFLSRVHFQPINKIFFLYKEWVSQFITQYEPWNCLMG